jgi:hypothetical protein
VGQKPIGRETSVRQKKEMNMNMNQKISQARSDGYLTGLYGLPNENPFEYDFLLEQAWIAGFERGMKESHEEISAKDRD